MLDLPAGVAGETRGQLDEVACDEEDAEGEGKVGALERGKYADLIVLSDDYFKVPTDEIRRLTSVLTVVDGKIVYGDAEFTGLDA